MSGCILTYDFCTGFYRNDPIRPKTLDVPTAWPLKAPPCMPNMECPGYPRVQLSIRSWPGLLLLNGLLEFLGSFLWTAHLGRTQRTGRVNALTRFFSPSPAPKSTKSKYHIHHLGGIFDVSLRKTTRLSFQSSAPCPAHSPACP